jgi:hypothetical protein
MIPMIAGYVWGTRSAARSGAMSVVANNMLGTASSADAVAAIDERVDRLLMVMEAMWSLLREHGYTDEQLAARIQEIDLADGMADGRHAPKVMVCRSCESKIPAGFPRCQICGTESGAVPGPLDGI